MRMSRINCSSEVRLVRSTQFSGVSILRRDCPDDHEAARCKRLAKFRDYRVRKRFAFHACKRIKKNERRIFIETRQSISRREWATKQLANSSASALRPDEYEAMAIPTYYRTAQEWKEPFTPDSRSSPTSALSLDHFEELALPDVYFEEFEQTGDAHAFAEAYTGFFKAAFEACLFVSLRETRTPQNRQQVIDSTSEKLRPALTQDPKKYSCRWLLHLMLVSKKQN